MTTKTRLRVLDGVAAGTMSAGAFLIKVAQPARRARKLRERFQRSDLEMLRADMSQVGQIIKVTLEHETAAATRNVRAGKTTARGRGASAK